MEEEESQVKTVFTIDEADIRPTFTQCQKHSWIKLNDHEIECTKCPTVLIIDPNKMKQYVSK